MAQAELASIAKREQDYTRAASLWDDLRTPAKLARSKSCVLIEDAQKSLIASIEAAEQLAIYYEHRVKQPLLAVELIRAAIAELRETQNAGGIEKARAIKMDARLVHRLARLERRAAR
jgi:hypothetical protein